MSSVRTDNFCPKIIILVFICICKAIFSVNAFLDNDVIKEPAVVCDHDRIMFTFETKNPFTGHVFVKGKYDDPNCRQDFLDNKSNGATVSIRIPQCGMRRIRQLQPQATSYSVTFIVNFHPEFITKFDKAFNVRCFYSQQDKIVTAQLEVSMVPTQFLDSTTTLTPNCQYSVRAGSVNGPVVRYIKVGDVLVHRWDCDNPDFGMLVKNCYVSDGVGRSVRILDETGCPTFSPGIQGNLNYDASLNTASVKVWAYKFPDRADLFFQCQIQICNKQSNECAAITPPHCPVASESNWTESQLSTTTSESVTYVIGSFEQPENEKMEIPHLPGYGRRSRAVDWDRPSGIELDNLTQQLHSALKEERKRCHVQRCNRHGLHSGQGRYKQLSIRINRKVKCNMFQQNCICNAFVQLHNADHSSSFSDVQTWRISQRLLKTNNSFQNHTIQLAVIS
ncbi:Cuticlin-1 [Trichinella spiralis]|uniref:Cuticlin-1 n=1 Tax=Trichinella spiralis TaxID=6334 RepID=A0ABR3KIN9_TRISP